SQRLGDRLHLRNGSGCTEVARHLADVWVADGGLDGCKHIREGAGRDQAEALNRDGCDWHRDLLCRLDEAPGGALRKFQMAYPSVQQAGVPGDKLRPAKRGEEAAGGEEAAERESCL